ncbi:integrase core domain-containing protein [Bremerella sp. JC770]|uniref:integrase core domain-containing protein n=1 Tax=Bremerella sp. JC770 TaxID=3232137 RepID=UPI0034582347
MDAFIESFNGSARAECMHETWLLSLEDAKQNVDSLRRNVSEHRPHSALGNVAR